MTNVADMQKALADAISDFGHSSSRSVQSREGRLGPSDLGFCRNKAALMTRGVEQTDVTPINAAQIGTAVHSYLAQAFEWANPDNWLVEHKVTATFPSGVEISGTADLIMTDWNALVDAKTVDGFEWIRREGSSQNHKFQRHTYALGAIQNGLLDDSKPVYVGNLYIDRSGKEQEPLLIIEEFDPTLTREIDSWIGDVIYAVQQGEDASRDIPAPVCERICEHFTACRGSLPIEEGGSTIEDLERIAAVKMFVEGRDMEKLGVQMKKEAGARLVDTNGTANVDGKVYTVRNTWVNPTRVESFDKQGYNRLDVRAARVPK
jgi:hypothetical protein